MNMFIIFSALLAACFAKVAIPEPILAANAGYGYAIDTDKAITTSGFICMKRSGYNAVFIRAYNPAGNGAFDTNAVNNIRNAWSAGLGTEVFMTPQPKSFKKGAQQMQEVYSGLRVGNIVVKRIWVQVTSPVNWGPNAQANVAFLNDIARTARSYGLTVGYYTSMYDWAQITKSAPVQGVTQLWYWNVNGGGPSGETPANFNDFRPFGGFTRATAKQFGQVEGVCGYAVNRDVYALTNFAKSTEKNSGEIVVGDVF